MTSAASRMIRGKISQTAKTVLLGSAFAAFLSPAALAADKPVMLEHTAEEARKDKPQARLNIGTLGSFTPSANHRSGRSGVVEERRFSFTPAGKKGADRKAVSVGVTSRVARTVPSSETKVAAAAAAATLPTEVAVDVAVGYDGFALSGGYSRSQAGTLVPREGAGVGVSYSAEGWKAALKAVTSAPGDTAPIGLAPEGESYSFELGGAYALTPGLAVKGGVRYDLVRPEAFGRDFVNRDSKIAEESGTIYLGTSVSF